MTYETIIVGVEAGVGVVTLNRPDRLNALTPQMFGEVVDALYTLPEMGARAVLLNAAGKGFCSGTDLQIEGELSDFDAGRLLGESYHPAMLKIVASKLPIVAAVQGACAGIGMSLALVSDFVVAARSAYFLQAFVGIGLVPDGGSTWLLPQLVGKARATELMMLGERLPAERAAEWGLIHKAVDDAALQDEAMALAARLASGPTRALGLMRSGIARALEMSYAETLGMEQSNQTEAGRSPDFVEGVTAFLQKRKPNFKGN